VPWFFIDVGALYIIYFITYLLTYFSAIILDIWTKYGTELKKQTTNKFSYIETKFKKIQDGGGSYIDFLKMSIGAYLQSPDFLHEDKPISTKFASLPL